MKRGENGEYNCIVTVTVVDGDAGGIYYPE